MADHSRAVDQVLKVEEGSLLSGLYRLELDGAIPGSWGTSDNNRRASIA